jgi:hypothetical protein
MQWGTAMRIYAFSGRLLGAVWLAALLLTACTPASGGTDHTGGATKLPAGPSRTTDDGVFLAKGECATADPVGAYRETGCSDPAATARVVSRLYGLLPASPTPSAPTAVARAGDRCPPNTDFVLTVSAGSPQGYACMRNLGPLHPGDPGAGGGPRTVTGDCVYTSREGEVRETSCDGSHKHRPQYRIVAVTGKRSGCPPGTALYVGLGPAGVGCARRL